MLGYVMVCKYGMVCNAMLLYVIVSQGSLGYARVYWICYSIVCDDMRGNIIVY